MPVAFVQLPALGRPYWPLFREYQRRSLSKLRNVGMAITIDGGHPTNVHPTTKKLVGERLAHWALVNSYGQSGPSMGPLYQSKSTNRQELVLTFGSVGQGLKTIQGDDPNNFEVAGSDGVFHSADARILDKDKIAVSCATVRQPVNARYAWSPFPNPTTNLINTAGIPASPFSTEEEF